MPTNKIDLSFREITVYLIIGIFSFLLVSMSATTHDGGDFSSAVETSFPTNNASRPTASIRPTTVSPRQGSTALLGLFQFLVMAGILLLIGLLIYSFSKLKVRFNPFLSRTPVSKEERLRFSRDKAAMILRRALETGQYTSGIIDAYIALDEALNGFRGAERPEHWTPKEYAIFVSPPVFQPTVYNIVEIFYNVRYGMNEGTREDVEYFLKVLYKLFENEVSPAERQEMLSYFHSLNLNKEIYSIPIKGDLTKPHGGLKR